jgi:hypothetical protein
MRDHHAYISTALRHRVIERAKGSCEYCRIHQMFSIYSHEIDHVIALKHGGQSTAENLVLACLPCNRHKGSDLTSLDPNTGEITALFNPRTQTWSEHFELNGGRIEGVTAIGRTTVFLLKMNDSNRLQMREVLISEGFYPDVPNEE